MGFSPRPLCSPWICLVPRFIVGAKNVVVDSLSRCHQVLSSEWTLSRVCGRVGSAVACVSCSFCHGPQLPAPGVFLFHLCAMATGTDTFLRDWGGLQAYTFPPFALIRLVLNKLTSSTGTCLTLVAPFWPQCE